MTSYAFRVDDYAEYFVSEIVNEIVELFGMTEEEALGRVNRSFSGLEIVGPHAIYSEPVDFWAKDIVYGHGTLWWNDENAATPLPYPG